MRRQLKLDDYDPPALSFNGGKISQSSYTDEFKTKDAKIETIIKNSQKTTIQIQASPSLIAKAHEQDLQKSQIHQQNTNYQPDQNQSKKIDRFLRKISPLMEKQLDEHFPLYQKFGKENKDFQMKRQSRLVHTLQNLDQMSNQKLQISTISWNASGVVVAAGYSVFTHESNCTHKSHVCLWSIFKRAFRPNKPQVILVPNCVSNISFHPSKPSLLAVGTFIGEVLLYDYARKQQPLMGRTIVQQYFHRDCITKLNWWAYRPIGKAQFNYNLLSLGADGKILLWQIPNQIITQQGKIKSILKYPLKGFLMLRKKQNVVIPVSGMNMAQSFSNKNVFVVGSEGGSILKASLAPVCHQNNSQGKIVLDMQQSVKFKPAVYPFMLNLLPKNVRQVKTHVEKVCLANKIDSVQTVATILNTRPQLRNIYPNPITFAYEAIAYPVSSISYNKYGLFIANGGEGYSRIYHQQQRQHLQSIQEGYEWGWINNGSKIGGFINQQFVVVDWALGQTLWSVGVGQGSMWSESKLGLIGVVCDKIKLKVLQLGQKIIEENQKSRILTATRIQQLLSADN